MQIKNKPAAILSLNMHTYVLNYGSVLQSFALQQYLKKLNKDSVIIDYVPLHAMGYYNRNYITYHVKLWPLVPFIKLERWAWSRTIKERKFKHFFKKNYITTKHLYFHDDLLSTSNIEDIDFDTFICGSDTVWKIDQMKGFNDVFFLNIPAANGKNKVAYACSMGSRDFTKDEISSFQKLTSAFKGIGLREKSRVLQFNQYLDKPSIRVVDPTLLLNAEDYAKIAKRPKQENYVLLYTIEENDPKMTEEARRFAKDKGLKLIEITPYYNNKYLYDHKVINDAGVEEWLGWFMNASYIITNSFHGMCFSVIFKKKAFLFERNRTDSKMPDLCNMLGLQNSLIPCDDKIIKVDDLDINWKEVYSKLDEVRGISKDFLKRMLND